ncbi:unnamed protein product, partial [marine sediment metagenome]
TLEVTNEKYGGIGNVDVYYGETRLWERTGGVFGHHVGETKTITAAVTPPPTPPTPTPPTPSPVIEGLKKYWPIMIGLALFGGTIAIVGRKK